MITKRAPKGTSEKRANWCGPYAIATILGMDYDAAYNYACRVLGKRSIKGMWDREVREVLLAAGRRCVNLSFRAKTQGKNKHLTFTQWRNGLDGHSRLKTYIVTVGHHYVVYSRDQIIDNQSKKWQAWDERKGKGSYKRALVNDVITFW